VDCAAPSLRAIYFCRGVLVEKAKFDESTIERIRQTAGERDDCGKLERSCDPIHDLKVIRPFAMRKRER
jgi:hypothetical protein